MQSQAALTGSPVNWRDVALGMTAAVFGAQLERGNISASDVAPMIGDTLCKR